MRKKRLSSKENPCNKIHLTVRVRPEEALYVDELKKMMKINKSALIRLAILYLYRDKEVLKNVVKNMSI